MEFFKKYLSKEGILDYMCEKLKMISSNRKIENLLDVKKSKKRISLITIFRDNGNGERVREKNIFVKLMSKIMVKYCDFKIYIIVTK